MMPGKGRRRRVAFPYGKCALPIAGCRLSRYGAVPFPGFAFTQGVACDSKECVPFQFF
jgi:hypothetical protein